MVLQLIYVFAQAIMIPVVVLCASLNGAHLRKKYENQPWVLLNQGRFL